MRSGCPIMIEAGEFIRRYKLDDCKLNKFSQDVPSKCPNTEADHCWCWSAGVGGVGNFPACSNIPRKNELRQLGRPCKAESFQQGPKTHSRSRIGVKAKHRSTRLMPSDQIFLFSEGDPCRPIFMFRLQSHTVRNHRENTSGGKATQSRGALPAVISYHPSFHTSYTAPQLALAGTSKSSSQTNPDLSKVLG